MGLGLYKKLSNAIFYFGFKDFAFLNI